MTAQDDVEALLTAVRALVAARSAPGADPLVLTSEHRVADPRPDQEAALDPAPPGPRNGDAILRDFARLTLIAAEDKPAPEREARAVAEPTQEAAAGRPDAADRGDGEPDLSALRGLVRDILREEMRDGIALQLTDEVRRLLRAELDRAGASRPPL